MDTIPFPDVASSKSETPQDLFVDVLSFVEKGDYLHLRDMCYQAISSGHFDIRFYVYYFYAKLNLNGIEALPLLLDTILTLEAKYLPHLLPRENFDKQLNACIRWLFDQINKLLDEPKQKKTNELNTPFYKASMNAMSLEDIHASIEKLEQLNQLTSTSSNLNEPSENTIRKIIVDLKNLSTLVQRDQPTDEESEVLEEELTQSIEEIEEASPPASAETPEKPRTQQETIIVQTDSPKMADLKKRLEIFSLLVAEQKHLHASILSQEIMHLVQNFDPIEFFPEVFSTFLSLQAKHHAEITPFWENQETHAWQCLTKLCKNDLNAFLAWDT